MSPYWFDMWSTTLLTKVFAFGSRRQWRPVTPDCVLASSLSLAYPVMKGAIHILLNQIQCLIREEVLSFANLNAGDREALPPGLPYDTVDTHSAWRWPLPGPHPHSGIPLGLSEVAWAVH